MIRPLIALLALSTPVLAQTLKSSLVASGFTSPVWVGAPAGDLHRLFVVEQPGRIRVVRDGVVLPTPFLDIDPEVQSLGREQGLLGLAFHPGYATNGRYYVYFTDNNNYLVLREYVVSATPGLDVDVSDTTNFIDVLGPIPKLAPTHNSGCLQFGPDGMLYVSIGDGGGAFDSGLGHDPITGNAQSIATQFGKILRLDVDSGPPWDPGDNPWSNDLDAGDDLIWALGLRNPWRFCFDPANGDLYVGDVGQAAREEIDWVPFAQGFGANFGWKCQEGNLCTPNGGCVCNLPAGTNPALVNPLLDFPHTLGKCAVVGGVVYRGSWMPELDGTYFYAELCTGHIYSFRKRTNATVTPLDRTAELDPPGPGTIGNVSSFGVDGRGEIYCCDLIDGEIYRIEQQCEAPTSYCVAAPNSTGSPATISYTGSSYISDNDLTLTCSGLPHGSTGYFLYGLGRTQIPMSPGFLCVRGKHQRLGVVRADATGTAHWAFDALAYPARVQPGQTWTFQFYYRDPAGTGTGFNWSNGLEVPFCY